MFFKAVNEIAIQALFSFKLYMKHVHWSAAANNQRTDISCSWQNNISDTLDCGLCLCLCFGTDSEGFYPADIFTPVVSRLYQNLLSCCLWFSLSSSVWRHFTETCWKSKLIHTLAIPTCHLVSNWSSYNIQSKNL